MPKNPLDNDFGIVYNGHSERRIMKKTQTCKSCGRTWVASNKSECPQCLVKVS